MKIAFVKQKYVPFGGGEGYLAGLLDGCAEKGHEVHVITTEWDNSQKFPFQIHEAHLCKRSRKSRVLSFASSVAEITKDNSFDVVFSLERTANQQIWRAGDCVYSKWLKQRANFESKFISFFNKISPGQRAVVEMERRCVESTPFIIANSQMIRRDLQEVYPNIQSDIDVIYNGYDPLKFSLIDREENRQVLRKELGIGEKDQTLLFVASGWRRKGLLELLQALPGAPELKLFVLGRDKSAVWRKVAKNLGVDNRVRFIGPRSDINRFYHAADITVLPSWYDSFGFVVLESLACGTPAVVSCFAGSHELILPGINGMTVSRPDDIQELQSALTKALSICPSALIAESVSSYSLENNIKKTLAVIERSAV